jgi:hypothetical protein
MAYLFFVAAPYVFQMTRRRQVYSTRMTFHLLEDAI